MNFVREAVESFESIADKYMHLDASKELLEWIASCLTQVDQSVRVTSYEDRLITYLTGPEVFNCLLYTSPSPRDATLSRMPSSA